MNDHVNQSSDDRLNRMEIALARLQRAHRRWRALALCMGVLCLMYCVLGANEKPQSTYFETVVAKELRVVDAAGDIVFSVTSNRPGNSTLSVSAPVANGGGNVSLVVQGDQASVLVNGGDRHSINILSSNAQNRLNLMTKTVETVLLSSGGDSGKIRLSKTIDGKKSQETWSTP